MDENLKSLISRLRKKSRCLKLPKKIKILIFKVKKEIQRGKMETLLDMFIEEGIGKGLKIGIEKGLQQGRLNTSRELVIDAIEAKFGNVPEKILKKIYSINDVDNLKNLHRQVIVTDSVEKLNRILEEM